MIMSVQDDITQETPYQRCLRQATYAFVKVMLQYAADQGTAGGMCLTLTVMTQYPGVKGLPQRVLDDNPVACGLVIQHEFDNLSVFDEGFEVDLSFNGEETCVYIPYAAIRMFGDPYEDVVVAFKDAVDDSLSLFEMMTAPPVDGAVH